MARTYEERLIAGLEALGWVKDPLDKSRFTTFRKAGECYKLFVGSHGALRKGECASRSYSIGDATRITRFYQEVLDNAPKTRQELLEAYE